MYSEIYQKFAECAAQKCGLIKDGTGTVVTAVSGGADSVCLLLLLREYYGRGRLLCVHFNHKIRGREAERDAHFTKELAKRLNVEFYYGEADVPQYAKEHGMGFEEAARTLRYAFLQNIAGQADGAAFIAVAHNRDDRIETVLHNIARGTSVDGLKGIEYRKKNVIRPILDLSRTETEAVCAYHHIRPVYDSTNADSRYTRNKIRNEVLPYLKRVFGDGFEERLFRLSVSAALDSDYLNLAAQEAFQACCTEETQPFHKILLDRVKYKTMHKAMQKRLIRYILSKIEDKDGTVVFPEFSGIYSGMIERVCAMAEEPLSGKILELPSGVRCITEPAGFSFTHETCLKMDSRSRLDSGDFITEEKSFSAEEALRILETKTNEEEFFDANELQNRFGTDFRIEFRQARQGDHFIPFGSPGGKSLRKFLIDRKIGRYERGFIVVAAIGSEILWIPGIRRSGVAPIDKNTTRVIMLRHIAQTEVYG